MPGFRCGQMLFVACSAFLLQTPRRQPILIPERVNANQFDIKDLHHAIDDICESSLTEAVRDLFNADLRAGLKDEKLAALIRSLPEEDCLCIQKDYVEACELGRNS
jgi:hypothetical protein